MTVDEKDMRNLRDKLEVACRFYKQNYEKLTDLIENIRNGVFSGTAADDFVKKYEAKKDIFDAVYKAVSDAESYMGNQINSFQNTMESVMDDMH